jgi:hypothetical protein
LRKGRNFQHFESGYYQVLIRKNFLSGGQSFFQLGNFADKKRKPCFSFNKIMETLFFSSCQAPVRSVLAWCAGARGARAPIAGAGISVKRTAPESDPDKRSQLKGIVS